MTHTPFHKTPGGPRGDPAGKPIAGSDFWAKYTEWLRTQGAISANPEPPTPRLAGTGGAVVDPAHLKAAAPAQQFTPEQENRSYSTSFTNQFGWGPDDIGKPIFYDTSLQQMILDPQTPQPDAGQAPDRFTDQVSTFENRYKQVFYDPFTGGQSLRPSPVPMVFGMNLDDVTGQLELELQDWMRSVTPTDELLKIQRGQKQHSYDVQKLEKEKFFERLLAEQKGSALLGKIIELEAAQTSLDDAARNIPTYGSIATNPASADPKFRDEATKLRSEYDANSNELDKLYAQYAENPALFQYKDMNEQARTMFTEPYQNLSFGQKVAYMVRRPSHWAKTVIGMQEAKGRTFVPALYDFFHLGAQALGIPLAGAIEPIGTANVKSDRLIVMRDQADWDEVVQRSDLAGIGQPPSVHSYQQTL